MEFQTIKEKQKEKEKIIESVIDGLVSEFDYELVERCFKEFKIKRFSRLE